VVREWRVKVKWELKLMALRIYGRRRWNDTEGRTGAVDRVRVGIFVGDGVCTRWGGVQVGVFKLGGEFKPGCAVGCCEFLVSIL
jgi:hypothetical protein